MKPSRELIDYVWAHKDEDVRKLALGGKQPPQGYTLAEALNAIQARQKLKVKWKEWWDCPDLFIPEPVIVEQASGPETALYKSRFAADGWRVLDMSGGMGADSYAFAQKARAVTYIDASEERADIARHNFRHLGQSNITCHTGRAEVEGLELARLLQPELIYIDPDRRPGAEGRVFLLEESSPDITTLLPRLTDHSSNSEIVVKLSPMADLRYLEERLPQPFDTHVVALRREAKELLLHFHAAARYRTTAVELQADRCTVITADAESYRDTPVREAVGSYLYDLYPAFAKVGYERFDLDDPVWKPATHTHLYFSDRLTTQFPGRAFQVLDSNHGDKKWLKQVSKEPLHLLAKNLPLTTDQLRRQLKIREGGNHFLFAYAVESGKRQFVLARRVDANP
ncbi:MAG: class I SAM-dependent methyltransferase [Porphyromonas sp.]|nr:class I SAM-dependent methyltransferase [Porphyromonas sp.]